MLEKSTWRIFPRPKYKISRTILQCSYSQSTIKTPNNLIGKHRNRSPDQCLSCARSTHYVAKSSRTHVYSNDGVWINGFYLTILFTVQCARSNSERLSNDARSRFVDCSRYGVSVRDLDCDKHWSHQVRPNGNITSLDVINWNHFLPVGWLKLLLVYLFLKRLFLRET